MIVIIKTVTRVALTWDSIGQIFQSASPQKFTPDIFPTTIQIVAPSEFRHSSMNSIQAFNSSPRIFGVYWHAFVTTAGSKRT
jgi:hypothetical protein